MRMKYLISIGVALMLSGCHKQPDTAFAPPVNTSPPAPQKMPDPTWTLANPCLEGVEEVYQTQDGGYMVWMADRWVKLASTLTPDEYCKDNLK